METNICDCGRIKHSRNTMCWECYFKEHPELTRSEDRTDPPQLGEKEDSQKLKQSDGKVMIGLLFIDFREALSEVTKCLQYNATHKYYPQSWMEMYNFVPERELIEAIYRHLDAHLRGELIDPEDNTPHLAHLIVDALFLLSFQLWRGQGREKPPEVIK